MAVSSSLRTIWIDVGGEKRAVKDWLLRASRGTVGERVQASVRRLEMSILRYDSFREFWRADRALSTLLDDRRSTISTIDSSRFSTI